MDLIFFDISLRCSETFSLLCSASCSGKQEGMLNVESANQWPSHLSNLFSSSPFTSSFSSLPAPSSVPHTLFLLQPGQLA